MAQLMTRIENEYAFECLAGPLNMCQEWRLLKTNLSHLDKLVSHQLVKLDSE